MNNESRKIAIASHSSNLIALTNSDINNKFSADKQWKVTWLKLGQDGKLFVFILFIPESTHIIVWNAKRAENTILTHKGIQLLKKLDKFLQNRR